MQKRQIVFLTHLDAQEIQALSPLYADPLVAVNLGGLAAASEHASLLVSFGTSVIVPGDLLSRFVDGAYNVHAASPDYPGRDSHHWAIYESATRFGATMHVMVEKVDAGPILDVELFDVPPDASPEKLLDLANDAALAILRRAAPRLVMGPAPAPLKDVAWGPTKRRRGDFISMCDLPLGISAGEFARRFNAFDGGRHDNLTVSIHGWTFRIDKKDGRGARHGGDHPPTELPGIPKDTRSACAPQPPPCRSDPTA